MTPERQELLDAIGAVAVADNRLQAAIDAVLDLTPTGYLHADQSWMAAWSGEEVGGPYGFQISLKPPEGDWSSKRPTAESLASLQRTLGADTFYACVIDGEIRYIAKWLRK